MKAPAQPSHHEANPRRENWIGYKPARIWVDTSIVVLEAEFIDESLLPLNPEKWVHHWHMAGSQRQSGIPEASAVRQS